MWKLVELISGNNENLITPGFLNIWKLIFNYKRVCLLMRGLESFINMKTVDDILIMIWKQKF